MKNMQKSNWILNEPRDKFYKAVNSQQTVEKESMNARKQKNK